MIGLIWAEARGRAIGRDGGMPWHLPEDLAHFREITAGSTVLMGRRTWDSLPERFRPLPDRRNLVLTRDPRFAAPGAEVVRDLEHALATDPVWVIGGAEIYEATIDRADRLEITEIDVEIPDADAHAPDLPDIFALDPALPLDPPWLTSRTGLPYRFRTYLPA